MPLANGEVFAGYRILRPLGAGGMGEVYLAQHPRLPRRDAIKVLPAEMSTNGEFRKRFNREADLAATLYHPNIVGLHDRGEYDGQLWISMDYIDGPDAGRLLRDRYPAGMPWREALEIISAMANALDYAHQSGLLHRDVKPANMLLTDFDPKHRRVLLADFGIARSLTEAVGLTQTNMAIGTVSYAAPEQLMGLPIDGRADQYALAVTAYQLLTGSVPFEHSNPVVVANQHVNATPPTLASKHAELAALDAPLSVALAKDPKQRFARCTEFSRTLALARSKAAAPATSQGVTRPGPVAEKRHPPPSTKKLPAPAPIKTAPAEPPPVVTYSERTRIWPIAVSAAVLILLLSAVFIVRPWQVDPSQGKTTAAAPTTNPSGLTFDAMRNFVTGYYAYLPREPYEAWERVDSRWQDETGLSEFVDFWATIKSVTLVSVSPRDAESVIARVRYVPQDGEANTEDRWLRMASVNGVVLLEESGRIGPVDEVATPPRLTPIPTEMPTAAATSDVTAAPSGGTGQRQLVAVRLGGKDSYDQMVLEFADGDGVPGFTVGYQPLPATVDPSGAEIPLPGANAVLRVALNPATASFVPSTVAGDTSVVTEAAAAGDFEAVLTWVVGLRAEVPFRVLVLTAPPRLVIEIHH